MLLRGKGYKYTLSLKWEGCSCCNSKNYRRSAKHQAKRAEKRSWMKDQLS